MSRNYEEKCFPQIIGRACVKKGGGHARFPLWEENPRELWVRIIRGLSRNYRLRIIRELSSENYQGIIVWELSPSISSCRKVEIDRDIVSKKHYNFSCLISISKQPCTVYKNFMLCILLRSHLIKGCMVEERSNAKKVVTLIFVIVWMWGECENLMKRKN
jgi:hypothetical protein